MAKKMRGDLTEGEGDAGGSSEGRGRTAAEDFEVDLGWEKRDGARG